MLTIDYGTFARYDTHGRKHHRHKEKINTADLHTRRHTQTHAQTRTHIHTHTGTKPNELQESGSVDEISMKLQQHKLLTREITRVTNSDSSRDQEKVLQSFNKVHIHFDTL